MGHIAQGRHPRKAEGVTTVISMWSGPRNISTTMMRAFGNRADMAAIDEPFYAWFLKTTGAGHPYRRETLAAYPNDWQGVIEWISSAPEHGEQITFLKHIAYHLPDGADLSFTLRHRNFLLIRDPRAMVASFADKYEDAAPIVRSYEMALRISDFLAKRGLACPVVEAADILKAPEPMLRALCAALGVSFDPAMLAWSAGPRPEDGPWAPHWYDAVRASTGFGPYVEKSLKLSRELEEIAGKAMPAYRRLSAEKLTA